MCLQGKESRLSLNRPTRFKSFILSGYFKFYPGIFQTVWQFTIEKSCRLSINFPDCSEIFNIVWNIFQTVQKYFTLTRNLLDCREIFKTVRKSSRLFGNLQDCPEIFQTVRKSSRLSGNLPNCPEIFQTVQHISQNVKKSFRLSRSFQTVQESSRLSGNILHYPEIFKILVGRLLFWNNIWKGFFFWHFLKNFPDGKKLSR